MPLAPVLLEPRVNTGRLAFNTRVLFGGLFRYAMSTTGESQKCLEVYPIMSHGTEGTLRQVPSKASAA